jgi:uncharacterized phage-associated protein
VLTYDDLAFGANVVGLSMPCQTAGGANNVIIPFSTLKTAQAAAVLFKSESTRAMGRMRLLKLLYIADRELLAERRRPITGDNPVAMDNGPVLTQTYDLIKGKHLDSPVWDRFFRSIGYQVHAIGEPGVGELSRREVEKLQEVATRYADHEDFDMSEISHLFPEWSRNKPAAGSSRVIPLDHILEATGTLADKDKMLSLARSEAAAKQLFAS